MQEILTVLQQQFDYVLIDSPPVMAVSDAILLSTMVDGVVVVADTQKTPRNLVRGARVRLSYARAKILGVVLNRLDVQNGGYTGYYYYDEVRET
jgi:Mrp family chromosome partitioning ATPase